MQFPDAEMAIEIDKCNDKWYIKLVFKSKEQAEKALKLHTEKMKPLVDDVKNPLGKQYYRLRRRFPELQICDHGQAKLKTLYEDGKIGDILKESRFPDFATSFFYEFNADKTKLKVRFETEEERNKAYSGKWVNLGNFDDNFKLEVDQLSDETLTQDNHKIIESKDCMHNIGKMVVRAAYYADLSEK